MSKCPNCGYVTPYHDKGRSTPQNRYFHGCVLPILAEHTGYTEYEMKGILKYKFNVKSTSALTTVQFEAFMKEIREWSSRELKCFIPLPQESLDEIVDKLDGSDSISSS